MAAGRWQGVGVSAGSPLASRKTVALLFRGMVLGEIPGKQVNLVPKG